LQKYLFPNVMNMQDKSKEELLTALQKLEAENNALKISASVNGNLNESGFQKNDVLYSSFFTNNHSVILLLHPETGEIRDANKAAARFYGWPVSALCKMHISEINTLPGAEVLLEMQKAKNEQRAYFLFQHRLANGDIRDVEVYSGPVAIENSTLLYSLVHDITERKRTEEELIKSEKKYRNLVENINEVVYEIDTSGLIKYVGPSVKKVLGFRPEEIIGQNFLYFVGVDAEALSKRIALLKENVELENDYNVLTKNGDRRWIRFSTHAIVENGVIVGGAGTLIDISERKKIEMSLAESQALYQSVMLASPDAITITDLEGIVVFASPSSVEMFGFENIDQFLSHNIIEFIDAGDRERAIDEIQRMHMGLRPGPGEYKALKSDNSVFDVEVNGEFIRNPEGTPINMVFVVRDITARKNDEVIRDQQLLFASALNEIAEIIILGNSAEDILGSVNRIIGETLHVDRTLIYHVSFQKECLTALCEWLQSDHPDIAPTKGKYALDLFINPLTEIFNKQQFLVSHVESVNPCFLDDGSWEILHQKLNIKSLIWYPFNFDADGYYIFTLNQILERREWAAMDIGFLQSVANQVGLALMKIDFLAANEIAQKELQHTEERYRQVVAQSQGVVWEVDVNGLYTYVSDLATLVFGYTPEELVGKKHFYDLCPENQRDQLIKGAFEHFANKQAIHGFINKIVKPDGTIIFLSTNGIPVLAENGNLIGYIGIDIDVTEKINAESELTKLSTAIEQSPVSIVITNLEGEVVYANTKAAETTGYSIAELLGNNPSLLKSGETQAEEYHTLWETISKGDYWHGVFHNKKKNGELYWESATISPIVNSDGIITHYLAIKEDITARKNAENQLMLSEEKYRSIFETVQDTYYEAAIDGTILEISPSVANLSRGQYNRDELIGTSLKVFYKNEQDRDAFFVELFKKGSVSDYEIPLQNKDGSIIPVSISSGIIYDASHVPLKIAGSIRDVSTRKLAEEELRKFRTISDQANYGNVITKVDGTVVYVNECFAKMHGWEVSEVLGKNLMMFHNTEQQLIVFALLKVIEENGGFSTEEVWHIRKDGSAFPTLMSAAVVKDTNGKPEFISATAIDISESKLAEKEIRELNASLELKVEERTLALTLANSKLEKEIINRIHAEVEIIQSRNDAQKANEAKSEFLSRMSHELRTPMNSILGFAQLLDISDLKPNHKKRIKHILSNGKHLLDLINEVLDISGIEAGRQSLFLEPVAVDGVVNEMLDLVHPDVLARNQTIVLIESPNNHCFAFADTKRLKQVLLNLINNAIKYNRLEGATSIRIDQKLNDEGENADIRISINDQGKGIRPEDISKLFQPFERIGADKTEIEGTGLGLTVVKKLMEAMGGKVGVDSVFGVGSTFWIELQQAEPHKAMNFMSPETKDSEVWVKHNAGVILYVEDNTPSVELVIEIIGNFRASISLVTTPYGKNAVKLALEHQPDLILLDLDLPDIQGLEVVELLKASTETKSIPVVVLSANTLQFQIDKLMQAGVQEYLTKPLEVESFLRVVDKWIK